MNRRRYEPSNSIKILLDENKPLEDFLRNDDLLNELNCYKKDPRLIGYFDKEKIKKLLEYMITEPEIEENVEETEEIIEKWRKFPFISSKIFELGKEEFFKYFFMTNKEIKEELSEKKEEKDADANIINNINETENENRIELIDYLFTFFPKESEKKELNYVLCGYFSSMINNLLKTSSKGIFIRYIYKERKDIFNLMIPHFYRQSISDALSKILFFEICFDQNNQLKPEENDDMIKTRNDALKKIFTYIEINMDNENLDSIYYFIKSLFRHEAISHLEKPFLTMINNKTVINSLISKPLNNLDLITNLSQDIQTKRNNFMIIIDIIVYILKIIKILKLEEHEALSEFFTEILKISEQLIRVNFNQRNDNEIKILQSFNELYQSPLGEYKIKIVHLLNFLIPDIKESSKCSELDDILVGSKFFDNGFAYIVENEWNTFYQLSFLSLLNTIFDYSAFHNILIDYLFTKQNIFGIIQEHINFVEKKNISANTYVGNIPFFISLSYKINSICVDKGITRGNFEFLRDINDADDDNQDLNRLILTPYSDVKFDQKYNKRVEEELQNGDPHESMKKYLNIEWSKYFNDNISDVIKQYKNSTWPSEDEKKMMKENDEKKKDINEANFTIYDKDGDGKEKVKGKYFSNNKKKGKRKKKYYYNCTIF